jgi:outer membrane lipoprotein SlyB
MRRLLLMLALAITTLLGLAPIQLDAATVQQRHYRSYRSYQRKARHRTLKRTGIGAAGGAAIGALAGGGKGAAIGGIAGAGAGYLYDRHKRHHGE